MTAALCGIGYQRPDGSVIRCTYLAGHPEPATRCSWFGVKAQDEFDADKVDYTPTAVQAMLDALVEGGLDPYIEAILAAAHHRKRSLRGVQHTFSLTKEDDRGT